MRRLPARLDAARPRATSGGAVVLSALLLAAVGCAVGHVRPAAPERPAPADAIDGATAACPRDAGRDPSGRCACFPGQVALLGSCVPFPLADAFCGPAAHWTADGCAARVCPGGLTVDLARGECLAGADDAPACADGAVRAIEDARPVCLARDAACPRGTTRAGDACVRGRTCPPGALAGTPVAATACRAIVHAPREGESAAVVDVGAWAALVLGVDGGPGSAELCRSLQALPAMFALSEPVDDGDGPRSLRIRIALRLPDNDVSRIVASTTASWTSAPGRPAPPPLSTDADAAVANAVQTLLELLRGLGGVGAAASTELDVRCLMPVVGESQSNSGAPGARFGSGFGAGSPPGEPLTPGFQALCNELDEPDPFSEATTWTVISRMRWRP